MCIDHKSGRSQVWNAGEHAWRRPVSHGICKFIPKKERVVLGWVCRSYSVLNRQWQRSLLPVAFACLIGWCLWCVCVCMFVMYVYVCMWCVCVCEWSAGGLPHPRSWDHILHAVLPLINSAWCPRRSTSCAVTSSVLGKRGRDGQCKIKDKCCHCHLEPSLAPTASCRETLS